MSKLNNVSIVPYSVIDNYWIWSIVHVYQSKEAKIMFTFAISTPEEKAVMTVVHKISYTEGHVFHDAFVFLME